MVTDVEVFVEHALKGLAGVVALAGTEFAGKGVRGFQIARADGETAFVEEELGFRGPGLKFVFGVGFG